MKSQRILVVVVMTGFCFLLATLMMAATAATTTSPPYSHLRHLRLDDDDVTATVLWTRRQRVLPVGSVAVSKLGVYWSEALIYTNDVHHRNYSRPGRLQVSGRMEGDVRRMELVDAGRRVHMTRGRIASELVFQQRFGIYVYDVVSHEENPIVSYGPDVLLGPMIVDPFEVLYFTRRRAPPSAHVWEVHRWFMTRADGDVVLEFTHADDVLDIAYEPGDQVIYLVLSLANNTDAELVWFHVADAEDSRGTLMRDPRLASVLRLPDGRLLVGTTTGEIWELCADHVRRARRRRRTSCGGGSGDDDLVTAVWNVAPNDDDVVVVVDMDAPATGAEVYFLTQTSVVQ